MLGSLVSTLVSVPLALSPQVLSSYPINNLTAAPLIYRMLLQHDLAR